MSEVLGFTRKKLLAGAAATGAGLLLPQAVARAAPGATRARAAKTAAGKTAVKPAYTIVVPLDSGPFAPFDRNFAVGLNIAREEINRLSGVQGRRIEFKSVGYSAVTPEGVTAGFTKALTLKPDAVLVAALLANSQANDTIASNPVPYLNGNTSIANVNQVASNQKRYFSCFQYDPTEVPYGPGIVPFLNAIEAGGTWRPPSHKVFVIEGDGAYEQVIAKGLRDTARKSGRWTVVANERVTKPLTDWGPTLAKIRAAKPAVIVNTDYFLDDAVSFLKQFAAKPTNSLVYFQYTPLAQGFYKLVGKAGEGVVAATVLGFLDDQIGRAFKAKVRARVGGLPDGYTGAGYDLVYMLANAWGLVGNAKNVEVVSRELRRMRYRGVCGTYWMDRPGQNSLAYPTEIDDPSLGLGHVFYQGQGGRNVIVYPRPYIQARYRPAPYQKS